MLQPQRSSFSAGAATLRRGLPLARGIVSCLVPDAGGSWDVKSGVKCVREINSSLWTMRPGLRGPYYYVSTSSGEPASTLVPTLGVSDDVTIAMMYMASGSAAEISVGGLTGSGGGGFGQFLFREGDASTAVLRCRKLTSSAGTTYFGGGTTATAGREYALVAVQKSGVDQRLYVDGVLDPTVTTDTTSFYTGDPTINFFHLPRVANAPSSMMVCWQRALSDVEALQWSRNPWQLLAPPPRRYWDYGSAAADQLWAQACL